MQLFPQLEKAKATNIPVIGFDSGVDSDIPITIISTDNAVASSVALVSIVNKHSWNNGHYILVEIC